jgi:glycosyltransferase involved in cell wall biosynthesis
LLASLEVDVHLGWENAITHLMTEGYKYCCVLLSRPEIAFLYLFAVRAGAINATVVYDTVDLHWLRWHRAAELMANEQLARRAEQSKQVERYNALGSDVVLAITESEKRILLESDPVLRVEVLPNIHPDVCGSAASVGSRRDIMFIGGFQHAPNEDGVCYFVREIWPLIRPELPGVVFKIVGSKPTEPIRRLESSSVQIVGYVPDPSPYFEQSRVFVSPLRYGAGMKGKIGQSMSFGLPVVTTSIGAEGMLLVDGQNALIADAPDDFARAVIRLYRDEEMWRQIAANSVEHIRHHFSPDQARRRMSAIFPMPTSPNPVHPPVGSQNQK